VLLVLYHPAADTRIATAAYSLHFALTALDYSCPGAGVTRFLAIGKLNRLQTITDIKFGYYVYFDELSGMGIQNCRPADGPTNTEEGLRHLAPVLNAPLGLAIVV
jgi:hypothetical protein